MILSKETLDILYNFSTINQNIFINKGNVLKTKSIQKTIYAEATIPDAFPKDFAIYNLKQFLSVINTFNGCDITFKDDTKVKVNENSRVLIDDFVFDPKKSDAGKLAMKVGMGTVRYASGQIAKNNPQSVDIKTPSASIAVRGTDFSMTVSETTPSAGVIVGGQYNSLQYGFLGLLSTSMTFTWQTGFSGSSKPVFRSSASDSSNSIYAMWVLTGTNNYILTKHNSAGALQWQQQMTVTGLVAGWSFTFDVYGKSNAVGSNIFVTLTINTNTLSTNNFPYLLAIPISKIPISQSFTFGNNYTLTFSPGTLTVQTPTLSTVSTGIMFNAGTDSNPVISTSGISSVSVNNTLTNTLI